ncbi:hypothetical protein GGI12_002672 [Dipsacomyces acuminosporus]|nr:hypothetical protein GGI12_002672 [Dipsacomyces acuminosporus]
MFYVKPFDGESFKKVKQRIPAIDNRIVSSYMNELRALHKLPDTFTSTALTGFVENLIDFDENKTIELIEERLRLLKSRRYIFTPGIMKREILKKSWSLYINVKELTKELMDYGVTHGVATLVNQLINMNKRLSSRGSEWRTMEVYEISDTSIILTALFLKENSRNARVTMTKLGRFFEEITAGEMFMARIAVLPAGFEHFKEMNGVPKRNEDEALALVQASHEL